MMSAPIPRALALLAEERNLAADTALVEAIPHLGDPAQAAALTVLSKRANPKALAALVAMFHDADDALKRLLVRQVGPLHAGIRRAVTSPEPDYRAAAVELIVHADDAKSADLLSEAIRSRCPRTRELAAAALETMTATLLDHIEDDRSDDDSVELEVRRDAMAAALGWAVQGWELHLQPGVLRAALWMDDWVGEALLRKIADPRTKIVHMLKELLEGVSDRRMAGFMLRALAIPDLRAAAAAAITKASDTDLIRALIRRSDLLDDPDIERGCRWIRDGGWLHDSIATLVHDDNTLADGAVRIFAASGGSQGRKIEVYQSLLQTGIPQLQSVVIHHLGEEDNEAAIGLLNLLANRADDPIAPVAARALARRGESAPAPPKNNQSDANMTGLDAFRVYFQQYEYLSPERRATLSKQIGETLDQPLMHFRAKLASGDTRLRCRALTLAGELGIVTELAEQVYHLAHDPDVSVRREAVALLGRLPGHTSERILRAAADDPDERVQANAVESADQIDIPNRKEWTRKKLDSDNSRVRANAVKSLLRMELRQAGDTLIDMLTDSSSAHRLSALWVVERLNLQALLQRVEEICRDDPDPRVREQAGLVLQALSAATHDDIGAHLVTTISAKTGGGH